MSNYCPKCDNMTEVEIKFVRESLPVKGEKIDIRSEVAICKGCGTKIFNQELDEKNLSIAYSIYRKKHNLLSPIQIANIRKIYALSQRALSVLLEWGEITITRYENGAIPDAAHNEVLSFIQDARNMKEMYGKNGHMLTNTTQMKLKKRIEELLSSELSSKVRVTILQDYLATLQTADEYSGFRSFDLDRIINMIVYIAEESKGVFTTMLNKLLFYSDFINFKNCVRSISGANYVHLPLGPVPNDYDWIIAYAIEERLLMPEEIAYPSGASGIQYKALVPVNESVFTKEEIKTMDLVIDYFKDFNCQQIKNRAHEEKAYKETQPQQNISYKYAKEIQLT